MHQENLEHWLGELCIPGTDQASAPGRSGETLLLSIARTAMACEFEVLLNQYQYPDAADHAVAALDAIEYYESLLSVYKPRSDLSTLNRFGAQRSVAISNETEALLRLAKEVHRWTGGAFDISSGSLSEVWGFSRREGRRPTDDEIRAALTHVGSELLDLDSENSTACFSKKGVTVNPGGIGKGFALDRAAQLLHSRGIGDFMLHGGLSSVTAHGHRQHPDTGGGWLVSLKHPWRWEEHLGTVRLLDRALATSGSGKQFFHYGGKRYSHIIDPRSGWPAEKMMSATVICKSGAVADALATAFFVMGPEQSFKFCQEHNDVAAILVYQDDKSRKMIIEACNLGEDQWQPA